MKRRTNKTDKPAAPRESRILNEIAVLIDRRLPDRHGFALLTFPLGEAVDPRMRYVGKGDRQDTLVAMQAWIDAQRGGVWGHDHAPPSTQWTTCRPDAPGIYLIRCRQETMSDAVDVVEIIKTEEGLTVWDRHLGDWQNTNECVEDCDALWLGPIPTPWVNAQPVAADDRADVRPEGVKAVRDEAGPAWVVGDESTPFEPAAESFFAYKIDRHFADAIQEEQVRFMSRIGDNIQPEELMKLIAEAFAAGVHAQFINPIPQ